MTLARKVAAVEVSLTPTELVVRWLDEAHVFGGLEVWVRGQLADDNAPAPTDLLARTASDGIRAALKGKPRAELAKAIDVAIFQTIFRFQLVLRINVLSHELIDRQTLLDLIFAGQIAMLADVRRSEPADPADAQRFVDLLGLILNRVVELRAFEQARTEVEARYLAGHPALFPDDAAAWTSGSGARPSSASWPCAWPNSTACPDPRRPRIRSLRTSGSRPWRRTSSNPRES